MPLGDPYLPQPSPEMIIEEWRNLNLPKEKRPEKQPPCIHKSVCCYVDRNTFCFYERKGIHCVHYSTSTRPAPVFTPHIPGKENPNTYRCCEVCPNVLSKPVFRCNCLQPEHDAQVAKAAREQEIYTTLEVVRNTIERYEDNEDGTIEDALGDIRNHLEGSLIDVQEKDTPQSQQELQQ